MRDKYIEFGVVIPIFISKGFRGYYMLYYTDIERLNDVGTERYFLSLRVAN